jgi:hypothetical protein
MQSKRTIDFWVATIIFCKKLLHCIFDFMREHGNIFLFQFLNEQGLGAGIDPGIRL